MSDPLKIFGMILMIVGIVVILSALPGIPYLASMVSVGPITVTEVSEISATRMITGVIVFVLGLVAYFGKDGLKTFR
jgi:uncharacterized membrane protein AbrB (regulator of aidB expression)